MRGEGCETDGCLRQERSTGAWRTKLTSSIGGADRYHLKVQDEEYGGITWDVSVAPATLAMRGRTEVPELTGDANGVEQADRTRAGRGLDSLRVCLVGHTQGYKTSALQLDGRTGIQQPTQVFS